MAKGRKDPKGRVLRKGETYRSQDSRYSYSYTDPFGRRKVIYEKDLAKLREKEDRLKRDQLDGLDVYTAGKPPCAHGRAAEGIHGVHCGSSGILSLVAGIYGTSGNRMQSR